MATPFQRNAVVPAIALVSAACATGLCLLGMLVIVQLELMQPGAQYRFGDDAPMVCYRDDTLLLALSRAPFAAAVTFVLVPALLAACVVVLQKNLSPRPQRAMGGAMWLAVAGCLAVPICYIAVSALAPSAPAASQDWVLYPPLSGASTGASLAALSTAFVLNRSVVALLLLTVLAGCVAAGRTRSLWITVLRLGAAAALAGAIWGLHSFLGRTLEFFALDRNAGTVFFDPAAQQAEGAGLAVFHGPQGASIAAILCCVALIAWCRATRP